MATADVVDFATFRQQVTDHKMKGLFRTGWSMDYPSIENFLAPIFANGASSNDGGYDNPKFNALITKAAEQTDPPRRMPPTRRPSGCSATDMASIPLWFPKRTVGWSDKVTGVKITPFGQLDWTSIALK